MAAKATTGNAQYLSKAQIHDANRYPVGYAGGSFVTADATGTPQVSPLSVAGTEVNLVVPDNATQLVITNDANALRIYETTGNGSTQYFKLPASTNDFVIDCTGMTNIYMIRDSGTVTVQFMFNLVR